MASWRPGLGSVRARTAVVAVAVVAVSVTPAAFGLLKMLRSSLEASVESSERSQAALIASLVHSGMAPEQLPLPSGDRLAQVVDASGSVRAASGELSGAPALAPGPPSRDDPGIAVARLRRLPSGAEGPWLVVSTLAVGPRGPWTVHVVASLDSAEQTARTATVGLEAGLPMLVLLVGASAWILTSRVLRPAEAIRAKAAARERRFVADASHELRSPLAAIQAHLDVALAHPERADWVATANEIAVETRRMQRIVEDLLLLARAGGEAGTLRLGPVDLDELVLAETRRLRDRGQVEVDVSRVSGARISGDRDRLTQVVRNLLVNAERHAARLVRVELGLARGEAVLVVANDGPGIAAPDRERIFAPFTRLDEARGRGGGGAGLGLAIARQIVEAHGGTIAVADGGPGARFVVRLPAGRGAAG